MFEQIKSMINVTLIIIHYTAQSAHKTSFKPITSKKEGFNQPDAEFFFFFLTFLGVQSIPMRVFKWEFAKRYWLFGGGSEWGLFTSGRGTDLDRADNAVRDALSVYVCWELILKVFPQWARKKKKKKKVFTPADTQIYKCQGCQQRGD